MLPPLATLRRLNKGFLTLLLVASASAQIRQINPTKLPRTSRVQDVYSSLPSVEPMARNWNSTWPFDTPKAQVVSLLSSSLRELRSSAPDAPQNEELLLLTGLVAHFAYNVDVPDTYEVAVQSFEEASKLAPNDYRAGWFLAMHRCQSDEIKLGMEQMLRVETEYQWRDLPVDFWDDYINCSTMSLMPAHTLRAIDHAVHLGEQPANYSSATDIAHNRYKSTNATDTYNAHEAWQATQNGDVRFTSDLCGIGFSAHGDWHVDIKDIAKGTCLLTAETSPYPSRSGYSWPTLLLLTRVPKAQETLDDFAQSFVKKYPSAHPISAPSCPATTCLAFEIVTNSVYESEGGGHFLMVAFAGQSPDFPGLAFEKPEAPPKPESQDKPTYYRPNQRLHRLPGTLYTIVELDSNESIFERSAADFRFLLKSIELD